MSIEFRTFELKRLREPREEPVEALEEKRGMMRGGSRGAFRRVARLNQRNSRAYANGAQSHQQFATRRGRLNRAANYLAQRGRRPGNRRVGVDLSRFR